MNATSIKMYVSALEADNANLKLLLTDKTALIERLNTEIFRLHQKIEVHTDDCESEVGSCERPVVYDSAFESDSTDFDMHERDNLNIDLYNALNQVADQEENLYKKSAFKRAADAIHILPYEVKSGAELTSGPTKVVGIGKTIAHMIDQFLTTGKITRSETANHKLAKALDGVATSELENEFKSMAYRNAAIIVRGFKDPITSGKQLSQGPHKVRGIGKSISAFIDTFLSVN